MATPGMIPSSDHEVDEKYGGAMILGRDVVDDLSRVAADATQSVRDNHHEYAKIMIVDDEPLNIRVVKKHLESAGFENFITTTESPQCMKLLRDGRPDVVLLDIMMPEVNGLDILREIRGYKDLRFLPVIILTAHTDAKTKQQALNLGATDFLAKPVEPSDLLPRVRNALMVKTHHDHLEEYSRYLTQTICTRTKELLETRQEANQQYLAGKADIATEVLHNVGNTLHSVNIAAEMIQQTLQHSRLPSLEKTAFLLQEHRGDLAAFLTNDRRGQLIPNYLVDLAQTLHDEHKSLIDEIRTLARHLEHIKAIVATQQKYTGVPQVMEPLSLQALLKDAAELSGVALERNGIDVFRQYKGLPEIVSDKQKLLQVFVNLMTNAKQSIKQRHGNGGGQLTIQAHKKGEKWVRIELSDNGVGIPRENLVKIFSHGFTTKDNGHGFGLHSCANIAQELGGALSARSDGPNTGATFIIDLPFKTQKAKLAPISKLDSNSRNWFARKS